MGGFWFWCCGVLDSRVKGFGSKGFYELGFMGIWESFRLCVCVLGIPNCAAACRVTSRPARGAAVTSASYSFHCAACSQPKFPCTPTSASQPQGLVKGNVVIMACDR